MKSMERPVYVYSPTFRGIGTRFIASAAEKGERTSGPACLPLFDAITRVPTSNLGTNMIK
jgi:hypothetical protein